MNQFQIILFTSFLVALVILGAFFSLAETSIMAANRYRLRHKARLKKNYAIRLLKLLKRPDRLLGAILIGNTTANMLASSLATLLGLYSYGEQGALLAAGILTFIVLIFSEIAPKTLAALYPDKLARLVVYPIEFILKILYPVVWLANMITSGFFRLLRVPLTGYAVEPLTREELRSVVYDTTGKISRQYQHMLLGVLDLNKLTVDDVMVPRHDIVGIDIELSHEKILEQIEKNQHDWIPFFREDVNQIMGILYMRDLSRLLIKNKTLLPSDLETLLTEPYFVPFGTALNVQLDYFQRNQHKVAFVVDEYGEIQGLVTLNDILEEIVGDFTSSLLGVKRIIAEEDGSYLVDGALTVREFNRITNWELPLRGPKTLNGLIIEYLEALPHAKMTLNIAGYPLEILRVKDNRVKKARIYPKVND